MPPLQTASADAAVEAHLSLSELWIGDGPRRKLGHQHLSTVHCRASATHGKRIIRLTCGVPGRPGKRICFHTFRRAEFYKILSELQEAGVAIIFYSSDDDELLDLCDRVIVLQDGQVKAELFDTTLTHSELVSASMGTTQGGTV